MKDRIGLAIIEAAERRGELKPGGVIVEATSGNTGIGLAIAAAIKGYRCIFTIPDKMSSEKIRLLRAYGAEVIVVPTAVPPDHPEYYIQKAKTIVAPTPGAILADQHYNPDNPEAHYRTTGPEIWEQTEGEDHALRLLARDRRNRHGRRPLPEGEEPRGQGGRRRPRGLDLHRVRADPREGPGRPYKVEGIGGDKIPTSLDFDVVDEWMTRVRRRRLPHRAPAHPRGGDLHRGLGRAQRVLGARGGAARSTIPRRCVVTILCDTGERYLSKLYDDTWMRENQMMEAERVTAGRAAAAAPRGGPAARLGGARPATCARPSTCSAPGASRSSR